MAIQFHPKHLERLFDLLCINRRLKPKKTPGHPMRDELDTGAKLNAGDASVYRSCIAIFLYVPGDSEVFHQVWFYLLSRQWFV
jgi:hypothetical protein